MIIIIMSITSYLMVEMGSCLLSAGSVRVSARRLSYCSYIAEN